jgi:hypothetical protein
MNALPVGKQIKLPGHFAIPVTLESARSVGDGFECKVRLPDGSTHKAVITAEQAAALTKASEIVGSHEIPINTEQTQPLVRPRRSLMPWLFFVAAIVVSFFVHELGHCSVAWLHGYPAIPTPAKEYLLKPIPENVQYQVALGGILGSVAALLAGVCWLYRRHSAVNSALLAGTLTAPGFYTLRFILAGRGHDATEFQEAQAALGMSYSGHAVDWIFVSLFLIVAAFWFCRTRTRPTSRLVGRLLLGALAALAVVVLLQSVNNAVFDPLFQPM